MCLGISRRLPRLAAAGALPRRARRLRSRVGRRARAHLGGGTEDDEAVEEGEVRVEADLPAPRGSFAPRSPRADPPLSGVGGRLGI